MKLTIDESICTAKGTSLAEVLAVLLVKTQVNIPALLHQMEEKEILVKDVFNNYLVTQHWDDVCSDVILSSDKTVPKEDRLDILTEKMRLLFPEGKKAGTISTYWRGNVRDVKLKLKKFFKLYGNKYTDEQILEATKQYVSSFNGNYTYMRALKYFIWKGDKKVDSEGSGYIEEISDLATFIENVKEGRTNNSNNLNARLV